MSKFSKWFVVNKLCLNIDKTCYMIFPLDTSRPNSTCTKVYINVVKIQLVASCRYLGVYIDEELKWTEHIVSVYNKLLKYVGIFIN